LDFSFLKAVATSVVEGRQNPARVGGVRRVIYTDGTLQRVKLMELNDSTRTITYDVITSEPPVPYSSAIHTIKLRRVTFGSKTLVELTSDFSNDASMAVIADAKWKRLEILNGLRESLASSKQVPASLEDFRKRAALAETLIGSLTERIVALEKARHPSKHETKGGQILLQITGDVLKGSNFLQNEAEAVKKSKSAAGVILNSGPSLLDEKRFTSFLGFENSAALIEYFKSSRDLGKEVGELHFSVFGSVSKTAKEALGARGKVSYFELKGFIKA